MFAQGMHSHCPMLRKPKLVYDGSQRRAAALQLRTRPMHAHGRARAKLGRGNPVQRSMDSIARPTTSPIDVLYWTSPGVCRGYVVPPVTDRTIGRELACEELPTRHHTSDCDPVHIIRRPDRVPTKVVQRTPCCPRGSAFASTLPNPMPPFVNAHRASGRASQPHLRGAGGLD